MNIHEHQAKELLRKFGAPVPNGIAVYNLKELKDASKKIKTRKLKKNTNKIKTTEKKKRETLETKKHKKRERKGP